MTHAQAGACGRPQAAPRPSSRTPAAQPAGAPREASGLGALPNKLNEWCEYREQVTDWEVRKYFSLL